MGLEGAESSCSAQEGITQLPPPPQEAMQQQVLLFQNYMEGNCSELIRAAQDESKNVIQKRTRQRLAEAAMKQKKEEQKIPEEGEVCDDGKSGEEAGAV